MATDADVLSIRVHLAAMREQEIRRGYDVEVARAALNDALGLPLDTPHELTTALARACRLSRSPLAEQEESARAEPSRSAAGETGGLAGRNAVRDWPAPACCRRSRSARPSRPTGSASSPAAAPTGSPARPCAGTSSTASPTRRASRKPTRRSCGRGPSSGRSTPAVRLQVRRAYLDLKARRGAHRGGRGRRGRGRGEPAHRQEPLRERPDQRDRLLRSETALPRAEPRRLAAVHDQRLAAAALELAAGTLSADSRS